MSNPAKVVKLRARPARAADLSFAVDGIVGESPLQLGASVAAFDFASFYGILGQPAPPNAGFVVAGIYDPAARLKFDSTAIHHHQPVADSKLLSLRAEALTAALDTAINARENAYYSKYMHRDEILSEVFKFYSTAVNGSKPKLLAELSRLSSIQASMLATEYQHDGITGVVKSTTSTLNSTTSSKGTSDVQSHSKSDSSFQTIIRPMSQDSHNTVEDENEGGQRR